MTTITVLDSTGATQTIAKVANTGQTTAANSLPVTLASDQPAGTLLAGAKTALTVTGLGTLAAATYVASNVKDNTTNKPLDVMVEVSVATTNTPAGNKQVVVFAQASYDNSVFQSGPTSGTTTTDEPNLTLLGVVPLASSSVTEVKSFSIAAAYGILPPYIKIVLKNDLGVALTSGTVATSEFSYKMA